MTLKCTMILGDCLDVMRGQRFSDAMLCIADLPYGVSGCHWDSQINLSDFWSLLYSRCGKQLQCLAHATQPFTTDLINSNRKNFRYDIVWQRLRIGGFFNATKAPLRSHESVLVFGPGRFYEPQMTAGKKYSVTTVKWSGEFFGSALGESDRRKSAHKGLTRFPKSIIAVDEADLRTDTLNGHRPTRIHTTQKPEALTQALIKSYSFPGSTVIDPAAGAFTTAIASLKSGRNSVSIEKDAGYFEAGLNRVREAIRTAAIDAKLEVIR